MLKNENLKQINYAITLLTTIKLYLLENDPTDFIDKTDDGVNNPGAIVFKYFVKNNSLTPLNIKVTKTPAKGEESGSSTASHKPKVDLSAVIGSTNVFSTVGTTGCNVSAGETFEYTVTLSMASGGTGSINADTGFSEKFIRRLM